MARFWAGLVVAGALFAASPFVAAPAFAQASFPAHYSQPSMSLTDALRHFARVTGHDVVFKEEIVSGLRAAPVRDAGDAYDALRQMLAGTGFLPRFTRRDAFILEREGEAKQADLALDRIEILTPTFAERQSAYRWYGEKLLELCLGTLRRSELARRSLDLTIYVWLSDDGRITDLATDGAGTEREVMEIARRMLKGMTVGSIPPAAMPQPVGLRIVAQ